MVKGEFGGEIIVSLVVTSGWLHWYGLISYREIEKISLILGNTPSASSWKMENDFLNKLTETIKKHISEEAFGVSELADEIGMSRSNLLRKIKRYANTSASQFIRKVRLSESVKLLKSTTLTVSEISYRVGFSSTSYFIKCFREEYGYPPGETSKNQMAAPDQSRVQQPKHQLAAIVFTDIEGYTAIMQKDEEKAVAIRNRHREIFERTTEKYDGTILQYYGDGTLSTFQSAINAVRCCIEMQQAFGESPMIPVRIGIHTGDILFSEDGIVGDGVNVASRIESMAVPQSVLISEKVYDEIKNQSGINTLSLGIYELKNVDKTMEVYAICNEGLRTPEKTAKSSKVQYAGHDSKTERPHSKIWLIWVLVPVLLAVLIYWMHSTGSFNDPEKQVVGIKNDKSIAVLPFRNDSNDSSNVYFINGLMESTLNNLQRIKGLRVISRTSVEKYRNTLKTSPEIAAELNVRYLIEGSGQKINDQILLHIQLIEAGRDEHLWSEEYAREVSDIFALQREIAENVIDEIQVIITPQERAMISKNPTENLEAYDSFLKGYDLMKMTRAPEKLFEAIEHFSRAIELDPEFARAYAAKAISYYFIDEFKSVKLYGDSINHYADQALLYDDKLPQSLIAKALYYMQAQEYELAVSYFEKVLEYNPNNDLVYVFLINLYKNFLPDTEKYLQYALKGIDIDVSLYDSMTASFSYLHISNAFIQSGFVNEAEHYIEKSLDYFPDNSYSKHLRAYILYAKNRDLAALKNRLLEVYQRDSMNLELMQDVAKICYYQRDYQAASKYYRKFNEIRETLKLNIFHGENAKIAMVLAETGQEEAARKYLEDYYNYAINDQSVYRNLSLTAYYAYTGNEEKAIEHFRLFSEEQNYYYWVVVFLKIDPLLDNIKDLPEFQQTLRNIERNFQGYHDEIRASLEKQELI